MTTVEKLNYLISIKSDIKTAIENKGVDMTGVSFLGYASKIGEIVSGVGYTDRDVIEGRYQYNISNSASFVYSSAFEYKSVQTVDLPNCLYVGNKAFYYCTSPTTVNLPACTALHNYAFRSCWNLSYISLPNVNNLSGYCLANCSALQTISLPKCSYLSRCAFLSCSNLNTIYMGIGLSTVATMAHSNALLGCSSLQSIYVPTSLVYAYRSAENWSYYSSIIYPIDGSVPDYYISYTPSSASGIMWIASSSLAFPVSYQISSYKGMVYFSSSYPNYLSFESCNWSSIETNIPSFGEYMAFSDCSTLQSVDLYDCTSLTWGAFQSCSKLTNVNLPKLSSLDNQTFWNCNSLQGINLPNCTYVGSTAFNKCYSLSYAILSNVSYVGEFAFDSCFSLYSADLRNVQVIGEAAFENCSRLNFSTPLYKCNVIGEQAFWGCIALTSLELPLISIISRDAFYGCSSLSRITIGYSGVCSLGSNVFYRTKITSLTGSIYVPASLVNAYKSAQYWSYFSTQIFPIPE